MTGPAPVPASLAIGHTAFDITLAVRLDGLAIAIDCALAATDTHFATVRLTFDAGLDTSLRLCDVIMSQRRRRP